jgi:hypothetical protein
VVVELLVALMQTQVKAPIQFLDQLPPLVEDMVMGILQELVVLVVMVDQEVEQQDQTHDLVELVLLGLPDRVITVGQLQDMGMDLAVVGQEK